uniref:Uncharacterized protein n=1 Tax=Tetraselmis sp. GSL018 TaxID=582737 RepID=A0A061SDU6_9CHLO
MAETPVSQRDSVVDDMRPLLGSSKEHKALKNSRSQIENKNFFYA